MRSISNRYTNDPDYRKEMLEVRRRWRSVPEN
jgi:hypothetical protein